MKLLRLILPITLFILSGVLAWVEGEMTSINIVFAIWLSVSVVSLLIGAFVSIGWALGGFDD